MTQTAPSGAARARASLQFQSAQRRALVERVLARLGGKQQHLIPFDEVMRILGYARAQRPHREPEPIPLDKIVGSVGRYRDFTRSFLPTDNVSRERWTRVAALLEGPGWPPIEVYKVGDVYFVKDGNHRVSVARALGLKEIEGYVTEIDLPDGVSLSPDMDIDEFLINLERAQFLERTRWHELRPDVPVVLTAPGRYPELQEHIDVHRYYLGLEKQRYIPYEEAVRSFIENVYLPIVEEIRKSGILKEFPGRTEADLYLWIARHRERLRDQYGLPHPPAPEQAVRDFAQTHSGVPWKRLIKQLHHWLRPEEPSRLTLSSENSSRQDEEHR